MNPLNSLIHHKCISQSMYAIYIHVDDILKLVITFQVEIEVEVEIIVKRHIIHDVIIINISDMHKTSHTDVLQVTPP